MPARKAMVTGSLPRFGAGARLKPTPTRLPNVLRPREKTERAAYLFLLPYLFFFLVFGLLPVVLGCFVSLTDWEIVGAFKWVGLRNYATWLRDDHLWLATINTLRYTLMGVPSVTILSLVLAIYVNKRMIGSTVSRTIFFAPYVISVTVTALLWSWILETDFGVLNYYLMNIGLPAIHWLTDRNWAMVSLIVTKLWWDTGFSLVIFLAGLQDISPELYEAARIDGANSWRQIRHITLPLLRPVMSLVVMLNLINSMQGFSTMFLMTQGGPAGSTTTVVYEIYEQSFNQYKMGYGAALSLLLFLAILALSLIFLRLFPQSVDVT
jgi:ABC-type sugar transport system permease subunit